MITLSKFDRALGEFFGLSDTQTQELREAIDLVNNFFQAEPDKAGIWFCVPNPLLGGLKPFDLVAWGKTDKLLKFVKTNLEENGP